MVSKLSFYSSQLNGSLDLPAFDVRLCIRPCIFLYSKFANQSCLYGYEQLDTCDWNNARTKIEWKEGRKKYVNWIYSITTIMDNSSRVN